MHTFLQEIANKEYEEEGYPNNTTPPSGVWLFFLVLSTFAEAYEHDKEASKKEKQPKRTRKKAGKHPCKEPTSMIR
jgi:hypothetical protein